MTLRTVFGAFLGRAPGWYKLTVLVLLGLNPLVLLAGGRGQSPAG